MSGKRKSVLQTRSVEDDSLIEEDADGQVVAVLISPGYDNVSSPDSTASGPTYAPRRPGFEHHAHHEISKNKRNASELRDVKTKKTLEQTQAKPKKREPLPMKLRALPQSFWQQPNQPTSISPAFPVLPPLSVQPRDGGGRSNESPEETAHEPLLMSPANTELLFSLFRGIEQDEGPPPPPVARRGRPRKAPSQLMARVLKDDDPCLGSAAGHEPLPLLMPPLSNTCQSRVSQQQQQVLNILEDRSTLCLPALSGVDHSYSQILSELVIRL